MMPFSADIGRTLFPEPGLSTKRGIPALTKGTSEEAEFPIRELGNKALGLEYKPSPHRRYVCCNRAEKCGGSFACINQPWLFDRTYRAWIPFSNVQACRMLSPRESRSFIVSNASSSRDGETGFFRSTDSPRIISRVTASGQSSALPRFPFVFRGIGTMEKASGVPFVPNRRMKDNMAHIPSFCLGLGGSGYIHDFLAPCPGFGVRMIHMAYNGKTGMIEWVAHHD